MSLFHKLQDIYFDSLNLGEELKQIPPSCDCCDAVTHLAGRCSCADVHTRNEESEKEADAGCLLQIKKLSQSINWFEEDLRTSENNLRPEDHSFALEGRLSLLTSLINNLKRAVGEIEHDLAEFKATCAHEALLKLRDNSKDLEHHAQELNKLL